MNTDETIGALQAALDNALDKIERLEQIAAALNEEIVELKQRIARLESGRSQNTRGRENI